MKDKILITGDNGYIGSVLVKILKSEKFKIVGLDTNFYKKINYAKKLVKYRKIKKDFREINSKDLKKINTVIHLASLSNDALGEMNDDITEKINFKGTIRLAKLCKKNKIERFIYVSSLSMYGSQNSTKELKENETTNKGITAYARTKFRAEKRILQLNSPNFTTVSLRPATVFGPSPNFRSDIVFNNLLLNAFLTKKILIKSSGKVWRPTIYIDDLCKIINYMILADRNKIEGKSFNVGYKNGNFRVLQMATIASKIIKGSKIEILNSKEDQRNYRISFKKLYKVVPLKYLPNHDLMSGGIKLYKFFKSLKDASILSKKPFVRVSNLKHLLKNKKINKNYYWNS